MNEPSIRSAYTYLYAFRRVAVVVATIGALVGLVQHIDWLLAASITVGIGEWLETTYYIVVLRSGSKARLI